jgi:hypothetical protein
MLNIFHKFHQSSNSLKIFHDSKNKLARRHKNKRYSKPGLAVYLKARHVASKASVSMFISSSFATGWVDPWSDLR